MIKQQKYFEEFKEIFHQDWKNCKLVYKNELFEKVTLILENKKICFNLINNSWISELQENPGKMIFPINMLDSIEDNLGDVNITLIHHPDNWLDPDNRKAFRKSIENSSDIILSGHEHAGKIVLLNIGIKEKFSTMKEERFKRIGTIVSHLIM